MLVPGQGGHRSSRSLGGHGVDGPLLDGDLVFMDQRAIVWASDVRSEEKVRCFPHVAKARRKRDDAHGEEPSVPARRAH
jgi:hypothetical protein